MIYEAKHRIFATILLGVILFIIDWLLPWAFPFVVALCLVNLTATIKERL